MIPDGVALMCAALAVFLAARILRTLHQVDGHNTEHTNRLAANIKAKIDEESTEIKEKIMGAVQDAVDAVTGVLVKAKGEIVSASEALKAQIVSLQEQLANIPGAEEVDLSGLQAVATDLDNLNEDAVVPEPPVEEPDEEPAE